MKQKILYFAMLALSLSLGGCLAAELMEEEPQGPEEVPIVGEYVSVDMTIDVGGLSVSSTRGETPSDDPVDDTEAERKVDYLWVFQFDASSLAIVNGGAKLITINDQSDLMDLPTENVLVTNNGNPSIVYVVANVGKSDWITVSAGFTLNDLLAATIPNPTPIYVDTNGDPESTIPMGGQTEESVIFNDHARVIVPIYRMFAKLMVKVGVDVQADNLTATPKALDIGQVPNTCCVGTLFTDDETPGEYPSGTNYLPWYFSISSDYDPDDYFIIYVPENIKGETDNDETGKKAEGAPTNALMVTTHVDLNEIDANGNSVVIKSDPQYSVYPGGNVLNNFNVRRNCVYRVTVTILPYDTIFPSANCLVAAAGETFAFYPYYRDEIGHTSEYIGDDKFTAEYYTFKNHLDPDSETLSIKGLKIIWQTPGCIGDNSKYDRVTMSGSGMETKIYVKTAAEGNALIAAYDNADCTGNILWSWHIWVTNNAPDNVDNAITYYHYSWDTSGIDTDSEVSGYPVMRCNLGALANFPTSTANSYTLTYGMLYQWGRKDPFPPMKTTGGNENGKFQGTYKYSNYTTTSNAEDDDCVGTVVEIGVNDNSNNQIQLNNNTGMKGSGTDYDVFNTYYTMDLNPFTAANGIDYSIKNPTIFLAPVEISFNYSGDGSNSTTYYDRLDAYNNQGDWLPVGDNDLWGGNGTSIRKYTAYTLDSDGFQASIEDNYGEEKTIFDPCPYGWRVSPGDLWLGFTKSGINYSGQHLGNNTKDTDLVGNVNCVNETVQSVRDDKGFTMYMQGWKGSLGDDTSFFPTQGSRLANGQPYHGGICGNYHNATVDDVVGVKYLNRDIGGTIYRVVDNSAGTLTQEDAIRRVDILHFHCSIFNDYIQVNTFEKELIYYNRAVAGPVRCVRDTKR